MVFKGSSSRDYVRVVTGALKKTFRQCTMQRSLFKILTEGRSLFKILTEGRDMISGKRKTSGCA